MNVLGTPSVQEVKDMCSNVNAKLPDIEGCSLSRWLKDCDPLLIDLLSKILCYSPKRWIRPLDALAHEYFDGLW